MENAGQDRTGKCPTCGRRFYKRKGRTWKPGIGAVRKRDRVGFTAADVRMALYQCKYAQWKQQEGRCGYCNEPMDPKHAIWISDKWPDGTGLAKWALGRSLVFNDCTDEFDANPRAPAEILEEYGEGLNGHYLWHKRCRRKFSKISSGLPLRGPAHVREYDKLIAQGFSVHEAAVRADDALRKQTRERMAEAREHKRRKRETWLHEEQAEARMAGRRDSGLDSESPNEYRSRVSPKRRRRAPAPVAAKPASSSSETLIMSNRTTANLQAEREAAADRPMTELERAAYEHGGACSLEERQARIQAALANPRT